MTHPPLQSARPESTVGFTAAGSLTLDDVQSIALDGAAVDLTADARDRIALGRAVLEDALLNGTRVYGLNTGLGHTRDVDIPQETLDQYQVDIVTSHAGAIGDPLPAPETRAIMAARLAGACRGYSGLSLPVAQQYADMLNADVLPVVPKTGTIGASDLGTLAAVASAMIGHGSAFHRGERMPAADALAAAGLEPVTLGLKEGLAVVSENSYTIGVGALVLGEVARLLRLADVAAALTMEAYRSSLSPLDPEVAVARGFRGQAAAADRMRALLAGSYLTDPLQAVSLQDPLSIRTVAQVHGAAREVYEGLVATLTTELNGSDDNPMTSPDTKRALSTGNFHPMEAALGFEAIRVALGHLSLTSERRISNLGMAFWTARKATRDEPLPAEAITTPGLGSYAYAALSARVKALAAPVTLGIPSLDHGQEDHATAAPLAVDVTRQQVALLTDMFVGEILLASAHLSWRGDVELGAGTRPYYDIVLAASREGGETDLAADLYARVAPRIVAATSRSVDLSLESDPDLPEAPPSLHPLHEKAATDDSHAAAV